MLFLIAKGSSKAIYFAVFWETYICGLLTGGMSRGSKAFSIQIPPLSLSQPSPTESSRNSTNPPGRDSRNNSLIGSTADSFQSFHGVGHFVKASKMAAGSRPSGEGKCVINNNTILLDIKTDAKCNAHRVTDIRRWRKLVCQIFEFDTPLTIRWSHSLECFSSWFILSHRTLSNWRPGLT